MKNTIRFIAISVVALLMMLVYNLYKDNNNEQQKPTEKIQQQQPYVDEGADLFKEIKRQTGDLTEMGFINDSTGELIIVTAGLIFDDDNMLFAPWFNNFADSSFVYPKEDIIFELPKNNGLVTDAVYRVTGFTYSGYYLALQLALADGSDEYRYEVSIKGGAKSFYEIIKEHRDLLLYIGKKSAPACG